MNEENNPIDWYHSTMRNYSGKFVVRLPEDLHRRLVRRSHEKGISLNRLCISLLKSASQTAGQEAILRGEISDQVLPLLQGKFQSALIGIVLFGSVAKHEDTELSDIDLLIVLKNVPIHRALYHWWDRRVQKIGGRELSPHFVTLPQNTDKISSLWLEVSENYQLIYQKNNETVHFLNHVYSVIQDGLVRKYWSNGHPYWVWRQDEK